MGSRISWGDADLNQQNQQPSNQQDPRSGLGGSRSGKILLSIVVPCFNEEAALPGTHARLVAVLEGVPKIEFELIYVDDGSRDGTLALLRGLQQADARVRVLSLSRNFGQQVAITAGLAQAAGEAAIIIDADLQDPPEVIPEMLVRWRQGTDVAYGVRQRREGEGLFKRWASKAFLWFINLISEISMPVDVGEFRLMDRRVIDAFLAMPERDRYLRGMVAWAGFRQEPVHFIRAARDAGMTKWSLRMLLRLATDGALSFSFVPLRLAIWFGLLVAGLAAVGVVLAIVQRIVADVWVSGTTALFVALLFMGGVQLVVIGVFGEYIGRIYREVKQRPLYLVKERLGFPSARRMAPDAGDG